MSPRLLIGSTLIALLLVACGATATPPENPYWTFDPPAEAKLIEEESTPDNRAFQAVYELPSKQAVYTQITVTEHSGGLRTEYLNEYAAKYGPMDVLGVNCNSQGKLIYLETGKALHIFKVEMCVDDPATGDTWEYKEEVVGAILESYEPK